MGSLVTKVDLVGKMTKDKNKITQAIIAKVSTPVSPIDEDLKVCAEDILKAIETKDVMGLVQALKAFDVIHDRDEEELEGEVSEHESQWHAMENACDMIRKAIAAEDRVDLESYLQQALEELGQ